MGLHEQLQNKLMEMSKLVAEMCDEDRFAIREIQRAIPGLSSFMLNRMNLIGREQYHPELFNPSTPAQVMLSRMPYADQVEALENRGQTPVATINPDGSPGPVTLLPTLSLTRDQVEQVSFVEPGGNRIWRALEDHHAWLVDHRTNLATRPSLKTDKTKWVIRDGNIVVVGKNPTLTPAEAAAAIAAAMNPEPAIEV